MNEHPGHPPAGRLILLTGAFEAGLLRPLFARAAPTLAVHHVETKGALVDALAAEPQCRLLAFCTAVIVPGAWLRTIGRPAYNIHPGPPNFPGRHPESWGSYRAAPRFAATLHEMAPRVDEGAIVDVEWIDVPPGGTQGDYGIAAFRAAVALLVRWAPSLADLDRDLPRSVDHRWSGHKTTHAELVAMQRVTPAISAIELERRRRAFASQPGSRLTLELHGLSFSYTAPETPA